MGVVIGGSLAHLAWSDVRISETARNKAFYDASCVSAIISDHVGPGWVRKTEPVIVAGLVNGYRANLLKLVDDKVLLL